jgi:hypothetical protein
LSGQVEQNRSLTVKTKLSLNLQGRNFTCPALLIDTDTTGYAFIDASFARALALPLKALLLLFLPRSSPSGHAVLLLVYMGGKPSPGQKTPRLAQSYTPVSSAADSNILKALYNPTPLHLADGTPASAGTVMFTTKALMPVDPHSEEIACFVTKLSPSHRPILGPPWLSTNPRPKDIHYTLIQHSAETIVSPPTLQTPRVFRPFPQQTFSKKSRHCEKQCKQPLFKPLIYVRSARALGLQKACSSPHSLGSPYLDLSIRLRRQLKLWPANESANI